jgi:hypothetical protein
MSIFSNSSHLEWRVELSDTILKGTHPRTIPARLGLIWFRGFRGEDLNVKVYDDDGRQVMAKAHMAFGHCELKMVNGRLTNESRVPSLPYFYMYNISCKIYGHTFSKTCFSCITLPNY